MVKEINMLKMELEATNKRTESIRRQLQEKEKHCETLESEVVTLKEEYEKINKFESLKKIINEQRSPKIKTGIQYNNMASHTQCDDKNQYSLIQRKT